MKRGYQFYLYVEGQAEKGKKTREQKIDAGFFEGEKVTPEMKIDAEKQGWINADDILYTIKRNGKLVSYPASLQDTDLLTVSMMFQTSTLVMR